MLSRPDGEFRNGEAHHSKSGGLGADGRKGRIWFGAVHNGTVAMRVGLNLDLSCYRKLCATDSAGEEMQQSVGRKNKGFVVLNRC